MTSLPKPLARSPRKAPGEPDRIRVNLSLPPEENARLVKQAVQQGMTAGKLGRQLLMTALHCLEQSGTGFLQESLETGCCPALTRHIRVTRDTTEGTAA